MARMRIRPRTLNLIQHLVMIPTLLIILIAETGPRLVMLSSRELHAGLLVLALLIMGARRLADWRKLTTPLDFGVLAFVVLTGVSLLFAPNPRRGLEPYLLGIVTPVVMAYAALLTFRRNGSLTLLFRGLLVSGWFIFLLALHQLLLWLLDVVVAARVGAEARPFRLWNVLDNPAIFGMFLAIVTPVILVWGFAAGRKLERRLAGLWCVLVIPLTLAHGTRSATLALLLGFVVTGGLLLVAHPAQPLRRWHTCFGKNRVLAVGLAVLIGLLLVSGSGLLLYLEGLAPDHADPQERINVYRIAIAAFREKPLTGWGVGSFTDTQLRAISYPPSELLPHAHNLILNLATETGASGVIGFGLLLLFGVIDGVRAWLALPKERLLLAGLIGGLCGFIGTGVLDNPLRHPALFTLALLLSMALVAGLPPSRRVSRLRAGVILCTGAISTAATLILLYFYVQQWDIFQKYPLALQNNDPALLMQVRTEADALRANDPNDLLAVLQAAYVWSQPRTPEEVQIAVRRFERAVALDSHSAVHWLNLSVLYRKAGDLDRAIETARNATRIAGGSAVAWLTLGQHFEAANHQQSAQDAYLRALQLASHWRYAAFWTENDHPARQAALEQFRAWAASQPPTWESRLQANDFTGAMGLARTPEEAFVARGFNALQHSETANAAEFFRQAILMNASGDVLAYAQLGLQRATGLRLPSSSLLLSGVNGPGSRLDLTYAQYMFWRVGLVNDWIEGVGQLDWTLTLDQLIP
jgi:O-antigen ligase/tetratricopeptide (TPR) repeat protein